MPLKHWRQPCIERQGCIRHKPGWFFKLSAKLANLGLIYRQGGLGRCVGKAIKLSIGRRSRLRATEEDSLSTIRRLLRWEGTKSRVVASWGYLWGWSAPIQVTLCPIDSCYSLNRGIRHLERSFHLSSTQGGLSPPLTTLGEDYHLASHYPGGLSPPREDYHLSLSWGIITP